MRRGEERGGEEVREERRAGEKREEEERGKEEARRGERRLDSFRFIIIMKTCLYFVYIK